MHKYLKQLYHKDIISVIGKHSRPANGTLIKNGSPLSDITAEMTLQEKGFNIDFEYDRFALAGKRLDVGQRPKKIEFKTGDDTWIFESLWLLQHSPPHFKGEVDFFYTKGYSKKNQYYYRLVFPLKYKFNFHFQIEESRFTSDLLRSSRNATKAIIAGDEFIAYTFDDETKDKHFLAIETEIKSDYDTFSEKAFALKNAIGYLTGYLAGDGGYFFAYTKKEMRNFNHYYYCSFRDTIKSAYSPLNTNPFSLLHHKRKIAEKIYQKNMLQVVSMPCLSELTNKLYSSLEFSSAVMLILESSVATLLFMPGGYAIVLETLADLIIGEDKLKLSPIKEKAKAKALRKSLTETIHKECTELNDYDLTTLTKRIEHINDMTNGARLKAPFTKLGIELLPADMDILEARNDFLHGRIPDISKSGLIGDIERKNKDLYYAALRFYTLLNMLILKWVGFDHYVTNYPMLHSDYVKIKLKEPYYRKL
jgi:hypothetical protein